MIRLPNSILCFFIKKNWTDFVSCARAGLVGNIGKFPENYRQSVTNIVWEQMKTKFSTFPHFLGNKPNHKKKKKISLLDFIVKKKKTKTSFFFNFPTLSRWPNTTKPPNITTKLKENTRGQWCFRSALHFLPMVLRQGSPVHDHDQRAGKWVFEQRTKWVLRQRRKRAGKWVCTSFQI